ncbi:unnamed protein product [Thelazia callipaeda]|uniref:CUB domain-containing protein n=1 Tax=Thelazia callipaeda TaxID=103827 RepID=A0A0N5CNV8_THECL|nr:unnamed protein product [Thelazia callipaeda]
MKRSIEYSSTFCISSQCLKFNTTDTSVNVRYTASNPYHTHAVYANDVFLSTLGDDGTTGPKISGTKSAPNR